MRDYGRDLYKQLCEQTEKVEQLEAENRHLRVENVKLVREVRRLNERIEEMGASMEARVEAAIAKAIVPVREEIAKKDATIEKANDEIARLKASKQKDSGNSSKPPSSNGYRKVPNSREASGRKGGGQKGHKGHRISIPKDLKELVAAGKAEHVIIDETGGAERYVSDWEIDLRVMTTYIERRRAVGKPPNVRYGAGLQSMAVYMQNVGMLSVERLAGFFREVTDGQIAPSEAALLQFHQKAALSIDLKPLIQDLLDEAVLHVDDTLTRTTQRRKKQEQELEVSEGTTFSACIRTYSNSTTTLLTANAHKDEEGIRADDILTRFHGILSHDHEAKFYKYGTKHATCGTHLGRELKGMHDLYLIPWAGEARSFFLEMNEQKKKDLAAQKTACDPPKLLYYENRYDELLVEGTAAFQGMRKNSLGYDELRKMLKRLERYKDAYMLFMRDYSAPFTNNQAERDLRHCKIKQKVSGCFRSWQGLIAYCNIRSFLDTTRKRGGSPFAALRSLFSSFSPC